MELQMIDQQIRQNQQQAQLIEEKIIELHSTIESLDDVKNAKKGSDILIPVSSGIFAKAQLTEDRSLIINVGADIAVEKDVDGTKSLLEEQVNNMREIQNQIVSQTEQLGLKAYTIEKKLQTLVSEK